MTISETTGASDLAAANDLMIKALAILDKLHHPAAARLDHAIVEVGLRPDGEGFPDFD